jgi:hypothetical protein
LRAIVAGLPPAPSFLADRSRAQRRPGIDPLLALGPGIYVSALLGVESGTPAHRVASQPTSKDIQRPR